MKKYLSLLLVLVLALSLVACGGKKDETAGEPAAKVVKALFVTEALGDNSFADASDQAMKRYADAYGIEYVCNQIGATGDAVTAVREAGQNGFDLVGVMYGAEMAAMLDAEAGNYPDTIFYMFTAPNTYTPAQDNIVAGYFKSCESAYGGGLVAGSMSTSGVCVFVGGMESINIHDWMVGYVQGVERAGATTVYSFIGGDNPWSDPAKAKELCMALHNNYNADVFWGCAGQSGDGVFQAVRELRDSTGSDEFWALGVDADQHAIFTANGKDDIAELIVTSCMKNPMGPVEGMVKTLVAGETVKGGLVEVGMAEGACIIAENDFYRATVSKEGQDLVASEKEALIAGTRTLVCAYGLTNDELNEFLAEHTLNYGK